MRPTDVDKIAEAVVSTLAGSEPGLLGCGSLSNPVEFDVDFLGCGTFECGGIALFACRARFGCGAVDNAANKGTTLFYCDDEFYCDTYGTNFWQAGQLFACVNAGQFNL
jgi:hypothetical protein